MDKVIFDGKVAIVYSPGYGAGWSTWNSGETDEMIFDKGLVDLILQGTKDEVVEYCEKKWPDAYLGGTDQLSVKWLPVGTRFKIDEYDGSESIVTVSDDWITA